MRKHPLLDYGYMVTSHSNQDFTADRVLVNVDTRQARENLLVSNRMTSAIPSERHR